jgi:hypothetical protein
MKQLMKKKIISSFLAGIVLTISMPSCTDLDENVYDKLPADSFGNTMVEVNALMGSTYNSLKKYWPDRFMYLSECGGSMAVTPTRIGGDWYDGGQYREIYMHAWTAQTSAVKNSWAAASESIGKCNATISLLENSELLSEAEKTLHVSSMRGIRAFWVYAMLDAWGNIPLVTSYDDKELPSTKPRQEVFDWLIQEVSEIAETSPDASAETYGKFTKGSAYTLLAKLYLNAQAWGVTFSGNAYQQCIEACDKVLGMKYYILEPEWKLNFNLNNMNSREAILSICFSDKDTEDHNQMMNRTLHYADNLSENANYGAWNGVCAQPDYVKLFDTEDPRYEGTFRIGERKNLETGETLQTGYKDPLIYTVDFKFIPNTEYDGTPWGSVVQEAGARCQKWEYAQGLTSAMGNHFHIFRLADVYLMKAEALLRSAGNVGEATKLVNAVRERAYGNSAKNYQTVDLEKVALERKFELAWEAWSRQDDIRFGTFEKPAWTASNCPRATGEHLKLYPVSQDAWQANQNIKQNPGYPAF